MKRLFLPLVLMWLISSTVFGQKYYGKVLDTNHQAIQYANVTAKVEKTNKFISGCTTDKDGNFMLQLDNKHKYYLEISFIGYKKQRIDLSGKSTELGNIILSNENKQLATLIIHGTRRIFQQKADRLIFNTSSIVGLSNGNVIDLLKKTPTVHIQQDDISILGQGNVHILINGHPVPLNGASLISYLKGLPAANIERIEVINNPPSKYDAENQSGLINIILKQNKQNTWNDLSRLTYLQTKYPGVSIGNTFIYKYNKWSLTASLDARLEQGNSYIESNVYYPEYRREAKGNSKDITPSLSTQINVDYDFSPNDNLGIIYSGAFDKEHEKSNNISHDWKDSQIFNTNLYHTDATSPSFFHSANAHYNHQFVEQKIKLTANIDYVNNHYNGKNNLYKYDENHQLLDNVQNIGIQNAQNLSASLDFSQQLSFGNIAYGVKSLHTQTNNEVKYYNFISGIPKIDPTQTDNFNYKENIQSLYLQYSNHLGKDWQIQGGLRWENTQTIGNSKILGQTNKRNYYQFFPTLYLTYTPNNNHILSINYGRRIKRPRFSDVNPFRLYANSFTYKEGNPFLQPMISNNIQIRYIYHFNYILQFLYKHSTDNFQQITTVNKQTKQQVITVKNYYNSDMIGGAGIIIYNPFWWWHTTNTINGFYIRPTPHKEYNLHTAMYKGFIFGCVTDQTFLLDKAGNLALNITYEYENSRKVILFKIKQTQNLSLNLNYKLLRKQLEINITANDIFNTSSQRITTFTNGIQQEYYTYENYPDIRIGLTYHFGNNKIKSQKHYFGNEDIQERIKQ